MKGAEYMEINKHLAGLLLSVAVLGVAGCTSSTSAVDDDKGKTTVASAQSTDGASVDGAAEAATDAAEETTQQAGTIIQRQGGSVQNRGVYIKMLVNKNPVTNFDINRRAAFLKLRRVGGDRSKAAENEMIEQVLKQQEAKRLNMLANDAMVNEAFSNFAKSNRATTAQMTQAMNQYGVGADHFKEYIRTQISWNRVVAARFQSDTTQVTEQEAVLQFRNSGTEKPELTEYSFQQVIFVVPANRRNAALLRTRRAEANAFRQRFGTCGDTIEQAKKLKDVSVIERKRILEPELPERWKDEVKSLDAKGTTRVLETERGVELLAVCETKQVNDDRAAQVSTQSAEFDSFGDKGSEVSKKYLDELKSRATVIYQ
jgi:peptidyl-prolyl cis-trans isomerase SurA